ncbi:transposase [Rhodovulum imhoffii]|uniref:Transposase n=1 Tax=Rhodovulum imhoffii TaxID=365340 RepID=A0A2T5BV73_9RHOB|nr:transposase [Rhodovulum imhoffii]PTN03372.1 transposase [Rhodovulum imhoffii]
MQAFIGIDIAKQAHWACAIDRDAKVMFSMAVENDPPAIASNRTPYATNFKKAA